MPARDVEAHKWWTLTAVCVATFMLLIDITIVNVALPDIAKALHSSFTDLQWVIDAYALSLAALLLTWGATSDRVGRRYIFVVGLAIFTVASLGCALSTSPLMLNLARAVQGVGGAAMFATSLALLADAFHGSERGTAVGIWGATIGAAVAIGPLAGGALTETIGWESIFYVNVPIGIAAIYISLTRVAESKDPNAGPNDWLGLVTFSGGLFLLIFALVRGNAEGWGSTLIVSFLIGAVVLLVAFVLVEARIQYPMFDLTLFRKPTFGGACIAAFALSASMFSMFLYLTLYLQNGLGLSPFEAGVRFLPLSLLSFVVAPLAGRLSARVPIRALIGGGMALVGIALLLMRGLSASSEWTALLAGFIVAGIGVGARQRAAGLDCGQRGPARARGHGLGDQLDLPPGGDRHRHRGTRRALPAHPGQRRDGFAGARAGRGPRPGPHAAPRGCGARGLPDALHRRAQRHPARGGDRRLRGRRALVRAHPRP